MNIHLSSLDAAGDSRGPRQGVESVEVGGRLLQVLAAATAPLMLRDLAAGAAMPPAKAHRYLVSLVRLGLVEQLGNGRYDIGAFAIQLGLAGLGRLDPMRVALEEIEALRETLGQTVALAVMGNRGPTIVRWLESNAPVSAGLRTGAVMPLTRSATGRAFLAFGATSVLQPSLQAELAENRRLGLAPGDDDGVDAIVEESRRHGLARVTGELAAGVHSVAAPVFDADGRMAMALLALGYQASFDADWSGPIAQAVLRAAAAVSARLGRGGLGMKRSADEAP